MVEKLLKPTRQDATPRDPLAVERFLADTRFAPLWLAVRVLVGWFWLEAGWVRLNGGVSAASMTGIDGPLAVGLTLTGIAVILGALTGPAAFAGGVLSSSVAMPSALMPAAVFVAAVCLTLAWKTAGWIGLDRWLLPFLGMPWRGGELFSERQGAGADRWRGRRS
jgi:thiosulfate dehydrogenase [quinone] large subunit